MGIIRIFLASAVVIAHSQSPIFGLELMGPVIAVQTFFIISGFYMSLILNDKYSNLDKPYKLFITNRFLKLYPTYWAVLIITILLSIIGFMFNGNNFRIQPYIDSSKFINPSTLLFLFLSNLVIFGQDIVMFLKINKINGLLYFTKDFWHTNPQLHSFLFIPQAWSLSVELWFYLIAPFIVKRRTGIIALLILISLGLRLVLYSKVANHDPWTYRFFPTELAFFLAGSLSYKLYKYISVLKLDRKFLFIIFIISLSYSILFQFIPLSYPIKQWGYYILMIFSIPIIFIITKDNKVDRYISEFSYPIYISHLFVITIIIPYIERLFRFKIGTYYLGLTSCIIAIIFSYLLLKFIINPIEKIRQGRLA